MRLIPVGGGKEVSVDAVVSNPDAMPSLAQREITVLDERGEITSDYGEGTTTQRLRDVGFRFAKWRIDELTVAVQDFNGEFCEDEFTSFMFEADGFSVQARLLGRRLCGGYWVVRYELEAMP